MPRQRSGNTPLLCWFAHANQREEQDKSCVKHCLQCEAFACGKHEALTS